MSVNKLPASFTVFKGSRRLVAGSIFDIAERLWKDDGNLENVLIFDDATAQQIDIDLRGSKEAVMARLKIRYGQQEIEQKPESASAHDSEEPTPGPGRPKLGVVAREVTLLPRHWDWLAGQPGGASVALRKLVEEAKRLNGGRDQIRKAQEAAYTFMSAMAGNEPGFEEATRALFAKDGAAFDLHTVSWPKDVRAQAKKFAAAVFVS